KDTNLDSPILQRDEMLTDVVITTASGFLGLTFTCCKCHDHKYDPFLQVDHYRLRAYFAAIEFNDYPVKDATHDGAGLQARIARYEQELAPDKKEYDAFTAVMKERTLAKRQKILAPLRKALTQAEDAAGASKDDWRVLTLKAVIHWVSEVRPREATDTKLLKPEELP